MGVVQQFINLQKGLEELRKLPAVIMYQQVKFRLCEIKGLDWFNNKAYYLNHHALEWQETDLILKIINNILNEHQVNITELKRSLAKKYGPTKISQDHQGRLIIAENLQMPLAELFEKAGEILLKFPPRSSQLQINLLDLQEPAKNQAGNSVSKWQKYVGLQFSENNQLHEIVNVLDGATSPGHLYILSVELPKTTDDQPQLGQSISINVLEELLAEQK